MITLITGIPGSGKTLYCIDKLLQPLMTATVKHEVDGVEQDVPRRILSNINGLLLDHVKIDGEWLNKWHENCQPGDVIVFDEVQKVDPWELKATGSKAHDCIKALETHRHMGVDFIVITQHPMLIHANLTRLVGRHLHVRRLGNMGLATVYEWDGCSRTLLYKNTMAKFPYRYGKKVFDLYKSAEKHTKMPRRVPSLVIGLGVVVASMFYIGPTVAQRLSDRLNPPAKEEKAANAGKTASPPHSSAVAAAPAAVASQPAAPIPPSGPQSAVGCIASAARCSCYDAAGMIVPVAEHVCRAGSKTQGMTILAQQPTFQMSTVYEPAH